MQGEGQEGKEPNPMGKISLTAHSLLRDRNPAAKIKILPNGYDADIYRKCIGELSVLNKCLLHKAANNYG